MDFNPEYMAMASRIRAALSTENGRVLKDWLKTACFMDAPMNNGEIDSQAMTQRISARRDLYIVLEQIEKDGAHVTEY
jgi:hypothetical protein